MDNKNPAAAPQQAQETPVTQTPEFIRPSARIKKKFDLGDFITGGVICSLAVGAAYFPWHVYLNPEQFPPPQMVFSRQGDQQRTNVDLLAYNPGVFDLVEGQFLPTNFPEDAIDRTITGSIPTIEEPQKRDPNIPRISQRMSLIDTDGRRALIRDAEGIYLIRPNSRLPGGSRIRMMLRTGDKVRLITTEYEIIDRVN